MTSRKVQTCKVTSRVNWPYFMLITYVWFLSLLFEWKKGLALLSTASLGPLTLAFMEAKDVSIFGPAACFFYFVLPQEKNPLKGERAQKSEVGPKENHQETPQLNGKGTILHSD